MDEAGVEVDIEVSPDRVRPGELERVVGNPDRIAADTGWRAHREVEGAVRETYRWTRSRYDRMDEPNSVV